MKNRNKNIVRILVCLLVTFSMVFGINLLTKNNENDKLEKELVRSQSYARFSSNDDAIDGTDNVKFSAFFLRDLDNNGEAEKLYGTVNEIGTEDDLYFEINVLTDGVLKEGKIEIENKNFYLATALPKDSIIKDEVFENNTKSIEFSDINNGTQKLIKTFVRSGDYTSSYKTTDAIGDDKTNYSRNDNIIHFTGKYCPFEGDCIDISKDINLEVDWYGEIYTKLNAKELTYNSVDNNISTIVKDDKVLISFDIVTEETIKELLLKNNQVEITLPEFNGYSALTARTTSPNTTYVIENGKLIINRTSVESENKVESISNQNSYSIEIEYPKESFTNFYDDDTESIELVFPISEFYEAYNNNNEPYISPLKSNVATDELRVKYLKYYNNPSGIYHDSASVRVGSLLFYPFNRYAVSKSKPINIYNGYKSEEFNDDYNVSWIFNRGNDGKPSSIITLKESDNNTKIYDEFIKSDTTLDSMQNITHYKGIKFGILNDKFDEDGYIKVYNDDTDELLLTLTSENFDKYNSGKQTYYYNKLLDHVRVEFYNLKEENGINIIHIKEINDSLLNDTYSLEEFTELDKIKTTLNVYYNDTNDMTLTHEAIYEEPYSESKISISRNAYASYDTVNTDIRIRSEKYTDGNEIGWKNSIYLVKLPEEFMRTNINYVTIDNDRVEVLSYEYIENNDGKFIKIYTENENIESYNININADITIVPKAEAGEKILELFAENGESTLYFSTSEDLYDLNNNGLTNDIVNYSRTNISIVAPNTLITTEAVVEYDDTINDEITIGPNTAFVDKSESTASIILSVQNNYSEDVDDIFIQGKIPYIGNTSILSGDDLKSEFDTTMITGINIPEEIKNNAKIYLSTEESPTNDLNDSSNKWVDEDEITDFSQIKSYLIDLSSITMNNGDSFDFSYKISLPSNAKYNDKTYSTHAIYFSIETDSGKYKTSTEPAKVGIQIVKKYSIDFSKYHKNSIKLLPNATYSVSEVIDNGDGTERLTNTKTGVSGDDGKFEIGDLFVNRTYVINEIRSPESYELNREPIRIYATVNEQNNVVITVISGDVRDEIVVDQGTSTKAYINIEDEVLAKLHINKIDQDTNLPLKNIKFKINGDNYSLGKVFTTDNNGDINISNLIIGSEYTLEETKADGYFQISPIKFTINNDSGNYTVDITSGNVDSSSVSVDENSIPTVNFNISNQKIPTYTLNLYKIKNTTSVDLSQNENPNAGNKEYIKGARFELYQGNKKIGEYETDDNGLISIPDLYAYTDGVTVDTTYTLKEIKTPTGYSKVKDIVFKVNSENGVLDFVEYLSYGQTGKDYTISGNQVNVEVKDNPIFVITKKDNETDEVIANVKFVIYNVDNGEVPAVDSNGNLVGTKEIIDGKEYNVVTTDSNGQISVDLPEGLYKLVEVDAGEKYNIDGQEYYFGIGTNRTTEALNVSTDIDLYGGSKSETIVKSLGTPDGGVVISGYTTSPEFHYEGNVYKNSGEDNYVFIIKRDKNGDFAWSYFLDGDAAVTVKDIAVDDKGNVFALGTTNASSLTFNDVTYNQIQYADNFIVKIDNDGNVLWGQIFGTEKSDSIASISKLGNGGCIVSGTYSGSITLGSYTLNSINNNSDAYYAIFDTDGNITYANSLGSTHYYDEIPILIGYTDGSYRVMLKLGTSARINNRNYNEGNILIKYDSSNAIESIVDLTSYYAPTNYKYALGTDDGGYILSYTTSKSTNKKSFYDIDITGSDGYYYGIILRCDTDGNLIKSYVVNSDSSTSFVGYKEVGNHAVMMLTGSFNSSNPIYFNGTQLEQHNVQILEVDENSDIVNTKYILDGATYYTVNAAAIQDYNNYTVVVNSSATNFQVDGVPYNSYYSGKDIKVLDYRSVNASEYNYDSSHFYTGTGEDKIQSVASTEDGGYIVAGYYTGDRIKIKDVELVNDLGCYEVGFVAKYNSDDSLEWVKQFDGKDVELTSVKQMEDGNYLIGGIFIPNDIEGGNINLVSNGSSDALILKLDSDGNIIDIISFGSTGQDRLNDVTSTSDGGFIAVGDYYGTITANGNTYECVGSGDAYAIKFNRLGDIEWVFVSGGTSTSYYDTINSVIELPNGNIAIAGMLSRLGRIWLLDQDGNILKQAYYSSSGTNFFEKIINTSDGRIAAVGNSLGTIYIHDSDMNEKRLFLDVRNRTTSSDTSFMAIFDENLLLDYATTSPTYGRSRVRSLIELPNNSFLLATEVIGGETATLEEYHSNASNSDLELYLINDKGYSQSSKKISGSGTEYAKDIALLKDGSFVLIGTSTSNYINADDYTLYRENTESYTEALVVRGVINSQVDELVELNVGNDRNELKVTTEVIPIDGVKGGTISGDGLTLYEKVKYGDDSAKTIRIVPDEDYEITSITVNGENYNFIPEADDSYTMPYFENMTENKHVQVKFSLKSRKITVIKKDAYTNETVEQEGFKFKFEKLEDREEPDQSQIGELTAYGDEYTVSEPIEFVEDLTSNIVNNGDYYFVEKDNKLIPTNIYEYQIENGGTSGVTYTTAYSYIDLDLTSYTGSYTVEIDAETDGVGTGYATITKNTSAPSSSQSTGRFMFLQYHNFDQKSYSQILNGGEHYYLHLGYYNYNDNKNLNSMHINSIKLYTGQSTTVQYPFRYENGKYISTNQYRSNTTSSSYIPINLTGMEGKYLLTINAEIDTYTSNYGYIHVSQNTDMPTLSTTNSTNILTYMNGTKEAADYTKVLEGNNIYYVHLNFKKGPYGDGGRDDLFTINSIHLSLVEPDEYIRELTTNSSGLAIDELPYGRYNLSEVEVPEGYYLSDEVRTIEFRDNTPHELIFTNNKKTEVIVHHYLKNNNGEYTEEKLADDEIIYGKVDDEYLTNPKTILTYNLEKVNNEYVYPNNKDGKHTYETIEVNYYYEKGSVPLTVKHLIEGTNSKVPLKDGTKQEDIEDLGRTGDTYNTTPVSNDNLSDAYELSIVPDNANGTYGEKEILVVYYYKPVERNVTLHKTNLDGSINLEGVKFLIDGVEYTTNVNGLINVKLGYGEHTYKEIETISGYELDETEHNITIDRDSVDNQEINITNDVKKGKVIVHHYIKDTTNKVPLIAGGTADDVITEGEIGKLYSTSPIDLTTTSYSLVSEDVQFKQGKYTDETIEVTYYYEYPKVKYKVEYYYNDQIDNSLTDEIEADPGTEINAYNDKAKDGFEFLEVKNLPLTVDQDESKNIIKVYYVSNLKITTEVVKHTEKYYDGTTADVKGGSISGEGDNPYESVTYKHDSTKTITITPDAGYEVAVVKINDAVIDVTSYTDNDGVVTLNKDNNFFKSMTEDKHIAVEFKKKSKVTVKYLEYGTLTELETTIEQTGYQDEEYTTERKNINTYREKKVETTDGLSGVTINNGDKFDESVTHVFTADDQEVIYWYEKIPNSSVVVKHIEIDDKGNSTILDEDSYENIIGTVINTSRQEFTDTVTGRNYYSIDGGVCEVCIDKDTNAYDATITENKVIEVKYFYQRSYIVTTENKTQDYGSISGDGLEKYEEIIKNGSNAKTIEITPNTGYRIKSVKINNTVLDITNLLDNSSVVLPAGYFDEVGEDKHIEVEFEKIPAKVIVKYIDKDTDEKIINDKVVNGFVGDPYNESKVDIDDYIFVGDEETKTGNMTEADTVIVFYYKKQFKITTDVIEHLESIRDEIVIPGSNTNERQITVKGGTISGEDDIPYETVNRGNSSTKQIIINADDNYIIKEIKINNVKIDITDNKHMELDTFENMQEDKHIEVRFERVTKKITVQYIDKDTGEIIEKIEQVGNLDDKYTTSKKDFNGYEYLESSDNVKGSLSDDVIVKYYYKKNNSPDIINPITGDKIALYLLTAIISLLVLIHFARKKNHRLRV